MKTYNELTPVEQTAALDHLLTQILKLICEDALRFNDIANKDDLQKRIDKAISKACKMQTPWFAHEYILDTCRDDLESMARYDAEDAIYSEPGENVVRGIVKPAHKEQQS